MEQFIRYGEYVNCSTVLGPGRRFVLWVQGCCFSCKGCIGQSYQRVGGTPISPKKLAELICGIPGIEGLTVSGGEPFLQATALWKLLCILRERTSLNFIVYTGFTYEELLRREGAVRQYISMNELDCIVPLLGQIDLLIDGRYLQELDDGRSQVGSANQRILNLSGRISEETIERTYSMGQRKIEIFVKDKKIILCGVPDNGQRELWKKLKQEVQK